MRFERSRTYYHYVFTVQFDMLVKQDGCVPSCYCCQLYQLLSYGYTKSVVHCQFIRHSNNEVHMPPNDHFRR